MADNFRVTAERMRDSSKVLHTDGHFHNACYLAGYVCECYLKVIVENDVSLPTRRTHNINELIFAINSSTSVPANFRRYHLNFGTDCATFSNDWNPNKRYDDNSGWDSQKSHDMQNEMERCFDQVVKMLIDNVIQ